MAFIESPSRLPLSFTAQGRPDYRTTRLRSAHGGWQVLRRYSDRRGLRRVRRCSQADGRPGEASLALGGRPRPPAHSRHHLGRDEGQSSNPRIAVRRYVSHRAQDRRQRLLPVERTRDGRRLVREYDGRRPSDPVRPGRLGPARQPRLVLRGLPAHPQAHRVGPGLRRSASARLAARSTWRGPRIQPPWRAASSRRSSTVL